MVKILTSNAGGVGLIPLHGDKIPHPLRPKNQNIIQKEQHNKFNKDFKNGPHQKNLKNNNINKTTRLRGGMFCKHDLEGMLSENTLCSQPVMQSQEPQNLFELFSYE